jgi:UDP:flavonoid glycosyltransferase YjiC (YdhE family)
LPDAIIANPPSFAGFHLAEKLGIPLHMAFTMPWSPTRATCSPFVTSERANDTYSNYMSYDLIDRLIWLGIKDMVNTWRTETLSLPPIRTKTLSGHRLLRDLQVPFMYCFSEQLLPRPQDWGPHISVTGFWFLDGATSWQPDDELSAFLDAGEPPIFVGFGSIVVKDPNRLTQTVLDALALTGRRAIVQKGWAGMTPTDIPPNVMMIGPAPHDWLFPRCSCVVHHGGAGTTSAGVRAGRPTVVVPFFGDQFFWGRMIAQMQIGGSPVPYAELTPEKLAESIEHALTPEVRENARKVGINIHAEDGVANAVSQFHAHLPWDTMSCRIDDSHLATLHCYECNFRLCTSCAKIIHANADLRDHQLKRHTYCDWGRGISSIGSVANGFVDGAGSLTSGLFHGIKDTFVKPVQGARGEGVVGAAKGVGSGLTSLATNTFSGTSEFFEKTAEGMFGNPYVAEPLGASTVLLANRSEKAVDEAHRRQVMEKYYAAVEQEIALKQPTPARAGFFSNLFG